MLSRGTITSRYDRDCRLKHSWHESYLMDVPQDKWRPAVDGWLKLCSRSTTYA